MMSIPIPQYLKDNTRLISSKKESINLSLECNKCQSKIFSVYTNNGKSVIEKSINDWWNRYNEYTQKNKWKQFESCICEDGRRYSVKRNFFGKIVDRYYTGDMPNILSISIIKVKCHKCRQEFILYDNRIHGYDAWATEKDHGKTEHSYEGIEYNQRKFRGSKDNLVEIDLQIFNRPSLEAFIEAADENVTEEEYSNAFSEIAIYCKIKDLNNKKVIVESE